MKPIKVVSRKRLFFDIETSPNIGFFWQAGYKLNIPHDNIIKERAIICICYKWEGESKVHSLQWDKDQSDKTMLQEFVNVANQADELIGHNGDKFDLPWIRTRCLFHGIKMFPKYTTIDTLKQSRSNFRFNSNKLDYIAKYLGFSGKTETGFGLWRSIVLDNCKDAMHKMVEYCKNDVVILEKVFQHLSGYVNHTTHYGTMHIGKQHCCPECGSENILALQYRHNSAGNYKVQVECQDCGKYHMMSKKVYGDLVLSKSVI